MFRPRPAPVATASTTDGPIAEFTALRAEMLYWVQERHSIIRFQLLTSGAVLAFSLATLATDQGSRRLIALIVPLLSYVTLRQHQYAIVCVVRAANYVRTELSAKVPGGLLWEAWLGTNGTRAGHLSQPWTTALIFVGAAVAGVVLASPTVWDEWTAPAGSNLAPVAWCMAVAFSLLTTASMIRSVRYEARVYGRS